MSSLLYLTVALSKINESEVVSKASAGKAAGTPSLFPDSEVRIRELIENVNVTDGRFLKYVPDRSNSATAHAAREIQQEHGTEAAIRRGALNVDGETPQNP